MALLKIEASPYLGGAVQFMRPEPGRQWVALQNQVTEELGYHLPLNEGVRSFADQVRKRQAYEAYRAGRGPWAPLAAIPGTSNHDEKRPGAADHGGPGGRARTSTEKTVVDRLAPEYGWRPDTVPGEPWHLDYVGNPRRVSAETVINLHPKTKTISAAVLTLIEGANSMAAPDLFHIVTTDGQQQYVADLDYESISISGDELAALEKAYEKKRVQINEYDRFAITRIRDANIAKFRQLTGK